MNIAGNVPAAKVDLAVPVVPAAKVVPAVAVKAIVRNVPRPSRTPR